MQLKDSGTIQVDGYNVRRTDGNQWLITRCGVVVDYVDSLAEVYPAIDRNAERIRDRVAKAEADNEARRALAEGQGIDPNHGGHIMSF